MLYKSLVIVVYSVENEDGGDSFELRRFAGFSRSPKQATIKARAAAKNHAGTGTPVDDIQVLFRGSKLIKGTDHAFLKGAI